MRVVIHLGVHKTGSTLLQSNLAANAAALRLQGVYYLPQEQPEAVKRQRANLRLLERGRRDMAQMGELARINGRSLSAARARGAHTLLMSEENYLGGLIHHHLGWSEAPARFYPRAALCLRALTQGLPPQRTRLLVYTRAQADLVRGHYVEALRGLKTTHRIAGFLDRVALDSFRFDALLRDVRHALPEAELVARPFEALRQDPRQWVEQFLRDCAIDPAGLALDTGVMNPALDAAQGEALRRLAEAQANGLPRDLLKRRHRRILNDPDPSSGPIALPSAAQARMAQMFADDTRVWPLR